MSSGLFFNRSSLIGGVPLALVLAFAGTGCLNAHIFATDASSNGGTGGEGPGTGGVGSTGTGGDGTGGDDTGMGGMGTGGMGIGGMGTGGSVPDAGNDGPTGISPTVPGQLVITEIMVNPNVAADDVGEWFEVYNPSLTDSVDMFGCGLFDGSTSNSDYILNHLKIAPRDFATFGRFGDSITGGFVPTFDYHVVSTSTTDVKFGNAGDAVKVKCNGVLIDIVDFGVAPTPPWIIPQGATLSLDPAHYDATDNDLQSNWCPSPAGSYHGSDVGSPGVTNPPCPRG